MDNEILQVIEDEIVNNPSLEEMKNILSQKGFGEEDIESALHKFTSSFPETTSKKMQRNIKLFSTKEVLDRVGYGFATHQFVNILFFLTAQATNALFIVGLFNGLKSLFSVIISSFLQEYRKVQQISKKFISAGGIVFGFSFLIIAMAASIRSPGLFAAALLIGSIGVVSYGDLYNQLLRENLKKERMGAFLARISQWGILVTIVSLLLSGLLMEYIPITGKSFNFLGMNFVAYGYLISFEITAFAFIFSGYVMSRIHQKESHEQYKLTIFIKDYLNNVKKHFSVLFSSKVTFLLMLASMIAGVAQALGNSYYGIFMYEQFKTIGLGGFMNVAVIYAVAIGCSLFGPWITTKLHRSIGFSPMLVFGTLLTAMMPFFAAWQPNIYAIGAANTLSIIGSAILGFAQGLLARKLLREEQRKMYFTALSLFVTIPFIVLIPIGAWMAQTLGLQFLFSVLAILLACIVTPIYIVLVAFASKKRL